jgi:glycosyltransferase involved in cell wall biosynthesis
MRIAFVSQPFDGVLPPDQSSVGLWTYHVGRRLAVDHEVTIYLKRPWRRRAQARPDERAGYRFVPMLPQRLLPALDRAAGGLSRPGRPAFAGLHHFGEYALQIALDLRRRRPDIVHVHSFSQFVPIIRALNPELAIALHMPGEWLSQLDYAMIERRLRQVDLMIGCSDHITNLVRRRFPHLAGRCCTIYNGIDTTIFEQGAGPPAGREGRSLLFVGRVSPEKGVHLLLEAFQRLAERFPDLGLDIVGPIGELRREYIVGLSDDRHVRALERFYDGRGYAAHLRERVPPELSGRVRFHGGRPQAAVAAFYRAATVLVNASLSESFGMTVVEAGFSGVPAVVSRVGGMQETVVDGRSGLIVEPGDIAGLADAVGSLLEDDARRRAMGAAAHARASERYSWERIAAEALASYQGAIAQRGRGKLRAQPGSPRV